MKYFFITTPIYYINDKPHLGHTYTTLAADILARFEKTKQKVFFLTGTDEHGIKNYKTALAQNKDPKTFCDEMARIYQKTWKELDIDYDFFIRTTDKYHKEFVKLLLERLRQKGLIYQGEYKGPYCEGCEEFKNQKDLIKGCCPVHKTKALQLKEKNWFFKLSQFQNTILEKIDLEFNILPEKSKREIISFLKNNKLRDIAISRPKERVKRGIELPWDKDQITYVWVDALINYISGPLASSGFNFNHKSWEDIEEKISDFWPADWHLIGKDIIRFHAIIWPAMLLAWELTLPKNIFVHGFFTIEGEKMSKTLGNVIDPLAIKNKYGLAPLRYYLFRDFNFGDDGDFSEKNLIDRYNADLADNIGNLLSRTLTLIKQYGNFPIKQALSRNNDLENLFKELKFKQALEKINSLAQKKNQLIDQKKPWQLIKEAKQGKEFALRNQAQENLERIFSETLNSLYQIGHYLSLFLPEQGEKIKQALKNQEPAIIFPKINIK